MILLFYRVAFLATVNFAFSDSIFHNYDFNRAILHVKVYPSKDI